MLMRNCTLAFATSLLVWGCAQDDAANEYDGTGVRVVVAPLTLPGISDVCYDLRVTNEAGETVVELGDPRVTKTGEDQALAPGSRAGTTASDANGVPIPPDAASICASQYGNGSGGDISYVGPCDASSASGGGSPTNTVTIWVDGIYGASGDIGQWHDPCGTDGCALQFDCVENQDVAVEFSFAIMRDAAQGFFDIAVNFEDIFCSAKLDCVDELLFRPNGERDNTAVLGFACTGGGAETCLYTGSVDITCTKDDAGNVITETWAIDPSQGPGNIQEGSDVLFGAAVYRGEEAFTAFSKEYWNVSLGLDEEKLSDWDSCTLSWSATASDKPFGVAAPFLTPASSTYPLITWQREFYANGQLTCGSHPLNTPAPGENVASVATSYTTVSAPASFGHSTCTPNGSN